MSSASTTITLASPPALERSRDLAAIVLLAGSVRQSDLQRAAGRPLLDLPITPRESIGAAWAALIAEFRAGVNRPELPLLVTANNSSGTPSTVAGIPTCDIRLDTEEPRGSAGSLRDIAMELPADAFMLVAPGHVFMRSTLTTIFARLAPFADDVVIHTDPLGRPTGFYLVRCGAMSGLPARGFVDFKEQALPILRKSCKLRVARDDGPAPLPIRSLESYIAALRAAAGAALPSSEAPAEEWMCTFTLVEEGARVDTSARLHDSVVLRDGRVGARASAVRSLVGPTGVVAAGEEIFDELRPTAEARK